MGQGGIGARPCSGAVGHAFGGNPDGGRAH
jgi:hypothetical protein